MTKGEVMEFLKKHEKDILYLTVAGVMGGVAYWAGVKHVYRTETVLNNNLIGSVLKSVDDVYGGKIICTTPKSTELKLSELGKLGEIISGSAEMNEVKLPDVFTHFIVIGPGTSK